MIYADIGSLNSNKCNCCFHSNWTISKNRPKKAKWARNMWILSLWGGIETQCFVEFVIWVWLWADCVIKYTFPFVEHFDIVNARCVYVEMRMNSEYFGIQFHCVVIMCLNTTLRQTKYWLRRRRFGYFPAKHFQQTNYKLDELCIVWDGFFLGVRQITRTHTHSHKSRNCVHQFCEASCSI